MVVNLSHRVDPRARNIRRSNVERLAIDHWIQRLVRQAEPDSPPIESMTQKNGAGRDFCDVGSIAAFRTSC